MLIYENGKKLSLLGFGLNLIINIAYIADLIIEQVFELSLNYMNTTLNVGLQISLLVAFGGFLIMWLSEKEMIDLLTFGALGISVILGLLSSFALIKNTGIISSIIYSLILSAFNILLAIRAKQVNVLLSLLLICAFVYETFSGTIFINIMYGRFNMPFFFVFIVWFVGYAVCSGIRFVSIKNE